METHFRVFLNETRNYFCARKSCGTEAIRTFSRRKENYKLGNLLDELFLVLLLIGSRAVRLNGPFFISHRTALDVVESRIKVMAIIGRAKVEEHFSRGLTFAPSRLIYCTTSNGFKIYFFCCFRQIGLTLESRGNLLMNFSLLLAWTHPLGRQLKGYFISAVVCFMSVERNIIGV